MFLEFPLLDSGFVMLKFLTLVGPGKSLLLLPWREAAVRWGPGPMPWPMSLQPSVQVAPESACVREALGAGCVCLYMSCPSPSVGTWQCFGFSCLGQGQARIRMAPLESAGTSKGAFRGACVVGTLRGHPGHQKAVPARLTGLPPFLSSVWQTRVVCFPVPCGSRLLPFSPDTHYTQERSLWCFFTSPIHSFVRLFVPALI